MTLAPAAHVFCILERLNPKAPVMVRAPTGSSPSRDYCRRAGPESVPPAPVRHPGTPVPSPPDRALLTDCSRMRPSGSFVVESLEDSVELAGRGRGRKPPLRTLRRGPCRRPGGSPGRLGGPW
ncbi:hypothetical protein CA984_29660 [Streptosporangium minutum]|uniref:Uncharacterized protein n=1 Tax=Streptosporangium minutum TaxID=569862 RepID=A0A243RCY8_9ACTN|nr:hypothetical protein CA984_29660 [Streptosporangium minutum]